MRQLPERRRPEPPDVPRVEEFVGAHADAVGELVVVDEDVGPESAHVAREVFEAPVRLRVHRQDEGVVAEGDHIEDVDDGLDGQRETIDEFVDPGVVAHTAVDEDEVERRLADGPLQRGEAAQHHRCVHQDLVTRVDPAIRVSDPAGSRGMVDRPALGQRSVVDRAGARMVG